MKKTYATPSLVNNGQVVAETRIAGPNAEIPSMGNGDANGSVGFYL